MMWCARCRRESPNRWLVPPRAPWRRATATSTPNTAISTRRRWGRASGAGAVTGSASLSSPRWGGTCGFVTTGGGARGSLFAAQDEGFMACLPSGAPCVFVLNVQSSKCCTTSSFKGRLICCCFTLCSMYVNMCIWIRPYYHCISNLSCYIMTAKVLWEQFVLPLSIVSDLPAIVKGMWLTFANRQF